MKVVFRSMAVGLVLGAASGAIARNRAVVRRPIPAPPLEVSGDNDGYEPLVTVGVEPSAVLQGAAGDALELQLSFRSRSERTTAIRYAYELVDDRGSSLHKPVLSQPAAMPARAARAARITTPAGLPDGYFEVRVTAAAADGVEDTLQIAERYFVVRQGAVTPVSSDEWFQSSNANLGRRP